MTERAARPPNRRTGTNNSERRSARRWLYERGLSAEEARDRTLWHAHTFNFQIGVGLPILPETPSNCYSIRGP